MPLTMPTLAISTCSSTCGGISATTRSRETPPSRTAIALAPIAISTSFWARAGQRGGVALHQHDRHGGRGTQPLLQPAQPIAGDPGQENEHFGQQHEDDGEQQQLCRQTARQRHPAAAACADPIPLSAGKASLIAAISSRSLDQPRLGDCGFFANFHPFVKTEAAFRKTMAIGLTRPDGAGLTSKTLLSISPLTLGPLVPARFRSRQSRPGKAPVTQ